MVERSHLYDGPLFSAIGHFIRDDRSVLQCVSYQRRAVPDHQYDIPSLGSCIDDLCFDFCDHTVDGLNPSAPNWISVQERTISQASPQMKQVLWSLSIVLSSQEGGFFACLHQRRKLHTMETGTEIPVYFLAPGDRDAILLPHHYYKYLFALNRRFWPQILSIYREEYRLEMCNLLEDWLMVFVALLDHFSPANKQFVLNAYLKYFISLAEIEEQASLYAGVASYQNVTYTEMKIVAQNAANVMFFSVQRHMNSPPRFPMRAEIENARLFGDMMCRWTMGSYAMPANVHNNHEDYFGPNIGRERKLLTETLKLADTISGDIVQANIPGYTPPGIVRQVWSYRSEPRFQPFRLAL
ncbi:hypothetical protein B0H14DRAFT_715253 [Mycena olivaceomarginata]|nr:hypothetical protein B0H14DRAFT_715253 [Mycena olivaceomarginata]